MTEGGMFLLGAFAGYFTAIGVMSLIDYLTTREPTPTVTEVSEAVKKLRDSREQLVKYAEQRDEEDQAVIDVLNEIHFRNRNRRVG